MGRWCIVGLGRAIEFFNKNTAGGSRMSDLIAIFAILCGSASTSSRGKRIFRWAFEVADTVAKGVKLFNSLSKENTHFLKNEIFYSKGVQILVSEDLEELLGIAAAGMREKLDVFLQGIIRCGNLCEDPQWHNLDRYFSNFKLDYSNHEQISRVEAKMTVQELSTLAESTFDLYDELLRLTETKLDYLQARAVGKSVRIRNMRIGELERREGRVRFLKKKSLWSRKFEEITEKLVDIATYLHQAILEAFESNGRTLFNKEQSKIRQRLGKSETLYAHIISEVDNILSDYSKISDYSETRREIRMGNLYKFLPSEVKTSLHSRLQTLNMKEELSLSQIKAEMGKIQQWLVPLAENTNRAHQNLDRCRDWYCHKLAESKDLFRLQTLYDADKQKTDEYILELMMWLHYFINKSRK